MHHSKLDSVCVWGGGGGGGHACIDETQLHTLYTCATIRGLFAKKSMEAIVFYCHLKKNTYIVVTFKHIPAVRCESYTANIHKVSFCVFFCFSLVY